jgi:hypothetical protein
VIDEVWKRNHNFLIESLKELEGIYTMVKLLAECSKCVTDSLETEIEQHGKE